MAILLAIMAILMIPRKKKAEEEMIPEALGEAALAGTQFTVPDSTQKLPDIDLEEKDEFKRQITRFVETKPDAVAQLLRNWLSED